RLPVRAGKETMLGKTVTALGAIDGTSGKVFVEGEYWNAVSETPIPAGQTGVVVVIVLVAIVLPQALRILREYERGVIFRLGKLLAAKGPGLIFLIPVVDRMVKMDLRVVTIDVAKQEIMTRDNVPATVDAVVYFRVVDPVAAVVKVENYYKATSLIAQTTLRSVLGQAPLDDLLAQRESINQKLQEIIDR